MSLEKFDRMNMSDIRQMLAGEHKSQNKVRVGYNPFDSGSLVKREIGDRWMDEDGREWEQCDGYKIKHGKFDSAVEETRKFPNCRKEVCKCTQWAQLSRLDEKMRSLNGMCFDCVVEMEHELRLEGKYEQYAKDKMRANAESWLRDAEMEKDTIIAELSKVEFATEHGGVEGWQGMSSKEELEKKIQDEFDKFRNEFLKQFE